MDDEAIRVLQNEMKVVEQFNIVASKLNPLDELQRSTNLAQEMMAAALGPANFAEEMVQSTLGRANFTNEIVRTAVAPANFADEMVKTMLGPHNFAEDLVQAALAPPDLAGDLMKTALGTAGEFKQSLIGPTDLMSDVLTTAAQIGYVDLADSENLRRLNYLNEDFMTNAFQAPHNDVVSPLPRIDGGLASGFHERLIQTIREFENELDDEHEVGVRLVNFGQAITFHLSDIGYWNPFLIWFEGETDSGEPVKLIQHVNQISILLMKLPRRPDKKRVGFSSP